MNVEKQLNELGIRPVQGQNFLRSDAVVEALVKAGELEGCSVLEIGPGTGVITEKLIERSDNVKAVEKDNTLYRHLKNRFESEDNLELINADILQYDIGEIDRCVSNLPFQHSSDILEILGEKQIQSALILQKELVEKIIADPGDKSYGETTAKLNYFFIPVKLREVSRDNYYPEPEVDTAILKLYPNKGRFNLDNEDLYFKVVKALFTNKRKKVRNAFEDARHILEIEKDYAKDIRDEIPYSEERVVNLGVKRLVEITNFLHNQSKVEP